MTTSALTLIIPPALAMDSNYRLTVNPAAIAARDSLVVAARSIATVDAANIAESQATRTTATKRRCDASTSARPRRVSLTSSVTGLARRFLSL